MDDSDSVVNNESMKEYVAHDEPKRPRRTLLVTSLAISAAVALTLSGCAAGGVTIHETGKVALILDSGFQTGDQAAIVGTPTVTKAGCVGIAHAEGNAFPAIWPRGTVLINTSPATIDIPGVGRKRQGDPVTGAGGYYGAEARPVLQQIAARCDWHGEVIGIYFG